MTDSNGALVEDANAVTKAFALLFEFQGDENATRHVMYNNTASRPSVAGNTKEESIEVQTETLNLTCGMIYVASLDTNVTKAKVGKNDSPYSNFFSAVYQPSGETFAVSKAATEIAPGAFEVISFTGNTGDVTASSTNTDVVAAVADGQVSISVDADASAGATVTLTDEGAHTATITVTIPE